MPGWVGYVGGDVWVWCRGRYVCCAQEGAGVGAAVLVYGGLNGVKARGSGDEGAWCGCEVRKWGWRRRWGVKVWRKQNGVVEGRST